MKLVVCVVQMGWEWSVALCLPGFKGNRVSYCIIFISVLATTLFYIRRLIGVCMLPCGHFMHLEGLWFHLAYLSLMFLHVHCRTYLDCDCKRWRFVVICY